MLIFMWNRESHSNTVSYDWVEGGVGMSYKSDGLIHWKFWEHPKKPVAESIRKGMSQANSHSPPGINLDSNQGVISGDEENYKLFLSN